MTLQFGLRVPTVGAPQDTAAYAAEVEAAGFDFMWVPDTPLLAGRWRDVYMHLGAAAERTDAARPRRHQPADPPPAHHGKRHRNARRRIRRAGGPCGRHRLQLRLHHRAQGSDAANMREATALWRGLLGGQPTDPGGSETVLDRPNADLPIILAATGPRMLALAGEIADGVLIHVGAAPEAVAWALERIDAGMAAAGRRERGCPANRRGDGLHRRRP